MGYAVNAIGGWRAVNSEDDLLPGETYSDTQPVPSATELAAAAWLAYQVSAQAALAESDKTVLRCYENAVVMPAAWATYRQSLRAIVGAASGDPTQPLPTKPAYPAGT